MSNSKAIADIDCCECSIIAAKKPYALSVLLLMIVAQNGDLSNNRLIWWGIVALFLATSLMYFSFQIRFDRYALWIFTFITVSLFSSIWAINSDWVFTILKSLVINAALFSILRSSIYNRMDVEFLFKLLIVASLVNATYILFANPSALMEQAGGEENRLGTQEGWNANAIGMMTSISAVISSYFCKNASSKKERLVYASIIVFLTVVSLTTGSRKAVVILFAGISAYVFFSLKGKRIRATLFIVIIFSLMWYLMMENAYFYSIVGWRVEAALSQFTGEGKLDGSAISRKKLIVTAIDVWRERPLFGYGLDCFKYFAKSATGHQYYAHNNYVELLADLGVLGFAIYYSAYFYILIQSWKNRKNNLSLLSFVLICIMLVSEYACVSYANFLFGILIMIMFVNSKLRCER